MSAVDALIAELVERGMDPATAASLVANAIIEGAASAGVQRTARQERNRRYYEGKGRLKASEKRLNKTDSDGADENKKKGLPHTPTKEKSPPKKNPPTGVKKKGSPLPSDWEPTERFWHWARNHRHCRELCLHALDLMREWAAANANRAVARKADWDAALMGFVRREAKSYRGQAPPKHPLNAALDRLDEDLRQRRGNGDNDNGSEILDLAAAEGGRCGQDFG